MNRRSALGTTLLALNLPLALSLGMLKPRKALADWPTEAFFATRLDDALAKLFQDISLAPSSEVEIDARDVAEDGSSVPVRIVSRIPDTRSVTLLSEKNPNPAVARFTFGPRADAFVDTRIKMGGTGDLIAVAESKGRYYVARKRIKVAAGGCAG